MELSLLQFLQGIFSLIFVLVVVILGIKIIYKYFKYKRWHLICVGLTWILGVSGWYGDSIQFILIVFFNTELSDFLYLLITLPLMPISVFLWLIVVTNLLDINKRKLILGLYFILMVIFEIIYFMLLFTDTTYIGIFINPFTVEFSLFVQIFLLIFLVIWLGLGLLFARDVLKTKSKDLKLKGKLLTSAFILYALGACLDTFILISEITVVITRIILTLSAILFYLGYILPDWIKKLFLKDV